MQDLFQRHRHPLFVDSLTINIFGFVLLVTHCVRARSEIVYNITAILALGYGIYDMSTVYSTDLAFYLTVLLIISATIVHESDRFRNIYVHLLERFVRSVLTKPIRGLFQDPPLPLMFTFQRKYSHFFL
jgi:hypothetical protein